MVKWQGMCPNMQMQGDYERADAVYDGQRNWGSAESFWSKMCYVRQYRQGMPTCSKKQYKKMVVYIH